MLLNLDLPLPDRNGTPEGNLLDGGDSPGSLVVDLANLELVVVVPRAGLNELDSDQSPGEEPELELLQWYGTAQLPLAGSGFRDPVIRSS